MPSKQSLRRTLKEFSIITIALFINALSWTAFLIPSKIVGGGVSGISSLIFYATGIPMAIPLLGINFFLILAGLKILGRTFGVKTTYSILVLSAFIAILQYYIKEPIVPERFMSSIIGGILCGFSVGLIFSQGGSTGGTDIIAMIVNKYRNVSQGKVILVCDIVIIASSFLLFHSIETVVYGYVTMTVTSYAIDLYLTGAKRSVQMFIFSTQSGAIADAIGKDMGRGVTFLKGKGWYTGEERDIVMVIVRKTESQLIFRRVKEIDPKAFISLASVTGVYGEGFEKLR